MNMDWMESLVTGMENIHLKDVFKMLSLFEINLMKMKFLSFFGGR